MGYIESNLLSDEHVVYAASLHWKIFWKSFAIIAVGIGLLFIQPLAGGAVIFAGLFAGLPAFIGYKTSEFAVTNKRVIIKVGLLRRRTLELLFAAGGSDFRRANRAWARFWLRIDHAYRHRRRSRGVSQHFVAGGISQTHPRARAEERLHGASRVNERPSRA